MDDYDDHEESGDELEYMLARSEDNLVVGVYVQSKRPITHDELIAALKYFIDRASEEGENLLSSEFDDDCISH